MFLTAKLRRSPPLGSQEDSPIQEPKNSSGTTRLTALVLDGVSRAYGEVDAVAGVSLEVSRGEFLALLGPSGAGKTTLLRLIAGFLEPDGGDIRIHGRSVASLPANRRDIGVVFQHYALFPHMTVAENVGFSLRMRRVPRKEAASKIEAALELVRLPDLGHRKPAELSGGQQQRVALARAVVYEPQLLLMDEPLAALDRKLRDDMRREIKAIQRELDVTVIYVTHDQDEALSLADRIAVMRSGQIEQVGTPTGIYDCPSSLFVAQFIGEANIFHGRVLKAEDHRLRVETTHHGILSCSADKSPGAQTGEQVAYLVRPESLHFEYLHDEDENIIEGRIEDIFFFGSETSYHVSAGGGVTVKATLAKVRGGTKPRLGESCRLYWRAEDALALPQESNTPASDDPRWR